MLILKPCPFCNEIPILQHIKAHKHFLCNLPEAEDTFTIECTNCSCAMIGHNKEEIINRWNKRGNNMKNDKANATLPYYKFMYQCKNAEKYHR